MYNIIRMQYIVKLFIKNNYLFIDNSLKEMFNNSKSHLVEIQLINTLLQIIHISVSISGHTVYTDIRHFIVSFTVFISLTKTNKRTKTKSQDL